MEQGSHIESCSPSNPKHEQGGHLYKGNNTTLYSSGPWAVTPSMALFSPRFVRKKCNWVCCNPVWTCRSVKYWSSPLLLGVPSTLNSLRVIGRRRIGRWRYLAYSRFMKFSVAPESIRAMDSALLDFEWIKNRIVIDFRSDMYTFES